MAAKYLLLMCFAFLFSCGKNGSGNGAGSGPREGPGEGPNLEDKRGDFDTEKSRGGERERLRSRGITTVDSRLGRRYTGVGGGIKDYSGPDCGESSECEQICDELTRNERRCLQAPEDMVRDIEDGLFTLINISEVDSVDFGPALLRGILRIEKDLILDLVKDHMSVGDLKSFLAWIAINEDIAEILKDEDRSSSILETAFKQLGRAQDGVANKKGTGLNVGLIAHEDTFFYLASDEENEAAFEMGHDILKDACSDKNCKMRVLCARENRGRSRSRSRVFSRESAAQCRTSSETRRRRASYNRGACYLHGSVAWSYFYELLDDRDVRDGDFKDELISVEKCNDFCGNSRSLKCESVF